MKYLIPWHRYGLIAELSVRLKGRSPQFGKTSLEKMIYLLQTVYGVDVGYEFELYAYGPFASQVLQDLDLVESLGGVDVHPVKSRPNGYNITPGKRNRSLRERAKDFLSRPKVAASIKKLAGDFGRFCAKDLELRSTIVYVYRDMSASKSPRRDPLIQLVGDIKPRFSRDEIEGALTELQSKGFVTFSEASARA